MNYFFKKTAFVLLFVGFVVGCGEAEDPIAEESTVTEPAAETVDTAEPDASLDVEEDVSDAEPSETEVARDIQMPQGFEQTPSPNREMVADLAELGVFDEMSEAFGEDFNLLEPINRGEYLALLYYSNNAIRASDKHIRLAPVHDPGFTDIDDSHPAYQYVQAFSNTGFSVGYQDNTFKPDQPLTREEMVAIKVPLDTDYIESSDPTLDFADADVISPEFTGFISLDRLLNGTNGTNISRAFGSVRALKPQEPVLGYEAAAAVWEYKGFGYNAAADLTAVEALEARAEEEEERRREEEE